MMISDSGLLFWPPCIRRHSVSTPACVVHAWPFSSALIARITTPFFSQRLDRTENHGLCVFFSLMIWFCTL